MTVHLALLLVAALWGGAFIAIKALLPPQGPLDWVALTWIRYASASILLLAVALAADPRGFLLLARRRTPLAFLMGILGIAGYNLGLNYGETQVPATLALLIIPINPVLTMVLSGIFLKERITPLRWLGSALAVAGLWGVVLAAPREGGGWGPHPAWGIAAIVGAAATWSLYTLLGKPLTAEGSPLAATALSTALGTLPILLLVMGRGFAEPWKLLASGGAAAFGWMGYLVVLCTVVAVLIYLWGLKRLPAGTVASYIYLMPAFGLIWGRVVLGEKPAAMQLAGAALLILGVVLASGRVALRP